MLGVTHTDLTPRAEVLVTPWAEGALSVTAGAGLGGEVRRATPSSGDWMVRHLAPMWLAGMGAQVRLSDRVSGRTDLRYRVAFDAAEAPVWEAAAGISLRL